MLDTDTKRRIDNCRDILVGKVPDPKSQVEQITIALIYKFMDDMDAEAEELGGKRKFFAGTYGKYGWSKLMASNMGGIDILMLYSEAIQKMNENPGIPALFRDIFKNAYLPYRDPETLRSFLKEINTFNYDHSEKLGDAFEYLLSVLGSQGDAGQFRTPRHIIEFIVDIIDPKKNETILDPACGTAGFLISAYKHILDANKKERPGDKLTPDERKRLTGNIHGYDISPDMVRLSLVNLYLHGFPNPRIEEYDTLTSEEKWNEYTDVILANPPFMSPKGGIRPHKRFSVLSNRSEVLFVDYMLEHLTSHGRAGIIVPEGIIFQSGTAYKQLREALVKEALIGVISLPSGVFQPYSGVKTSIIILDKRIAKDRPTILFSDVKSIGVSLGVKRTVTEQNDLPCVLKDYASYYADKPVSHHSWYAKRNEVLANDCNLSGERYRPVEVRAGTRTVKLKEVCSLTKGTHSSTKTEPGPYPLIVTAEKWLTSSDYHMEGEAVCVPLISSSGHGRASLKRIHFASGKFALANLLAAIQPKDLNILKVKFLYLVLDRLKDKMANLMKGAANVSMKVEDLAEFQIPLPPLEIQNEIVAELEGYQKVIDGARAVIENYKPHIPIQAEWPMVELDKVCEINPESINPELVFPKQNIFYIDISSVENETGRFLGYTELNSSNVPSRARRRIQTNDVLLSTVRPNLKAFTLLRDVCDRAVASTGFAVLRAKLEYIIPGFLFESVRSMSAVEQMIGMMGKGAYPSINQSDVASIKIPLAPLEIQRDIVAELESEQALVSTNRKLIARFEKKIQTTLTRVWGEKETT